MCRSKAPRARPRIRPTPSSTGSSSVMPTIPTRPRSGAEECEIGAVRCGRPVSDRNIKLLLFLTVLVVSLLPLLAAAMYFLDRSLQTSLNLGFNPHISWVLEDSANNLLTLRSSILSVRPNTVPSSKRSSSFNMYMPNPSWFVRACSDLCASISRWASWRR